jgi:hypothetical protein
VGKLRLVLVGIVTIAACGGNDTGINDECNPLGGASCLMPWPSMAFAKTDTTSATGYRVDLPIEAMPKNGDGVSVDPKMFDRWDGFSPTGPMLAMFPTGVECDRHPAAGVAPEDAICDNLPSFKDPDASLAADSPIALVDLDSGERTPFFAEVDANITMPAQQALIIRPLARLHPNTHYAVAITNRVKAADGSALPISAGFAALRDGGDFSHPRMAAVKERAAVMFAGLGTAGYNKADLVLAWDFQTATDEFLRADLTTMRDAAIPAMGANGADLTFTTTEQPQITGIYKSYVGTYKSPNFLTDGENDDSIIARDAGGLPMMSGLRDAQFAALIPQCATTHALPLTTIIFGHGLFGSAKEYLSDSFTQSLAEDNCFVIIAGDFIGLTSRQLALAPLAVNDLNRGNQVTEKLAQSIVDFMALETLTRGQLGAHPEFQVNGVSVIDPARTYYVGGSLGGIMGNVFMAYDPNITRGVLAVPGGAWSMLFERSNAWHLLQGAAMGSYTDFTQYQMLLAFFGMGFEPYDPITTAAHVIHDPLGNVPAKNILMWYTMGDCLVTNITTELVARTMGIDLIGPAVKTVWGMAPTPGPLANGINVFNAHPTPLPPETNIPPATDNGTHSGINKKAAALASVKAFLLDSQMAVQTCHDAQQQLVACDCATGACD